MGEEKRHGHSPKGTETPVLCRASWVDSTSPSSLPLRMQQRWSWGVSPEDNGQISYGGKCWLLLPLSLVPQPIVCGNATTPGTLPSFSSQK